MVYHLVLFVVSQEMMLEDTLNPYHSVSINPSDGQLLVAGNELSGASLYDLRNWKRCVCVSERGLSQVAFVNYILLKLFSWKSISNSEYFKFKYYYLY